MCTERMGWPTTPAEVRDWEGHDPETLQGMLDNLAQGLDLIED